MEDNDGVLTLEKHGGFVFREPEWLEETSSTNDVLRERLAAGQARLGEVSAAHRQTRGRGRRGNPWLTSPGRDLAFSFIWRGDVPPTRTGTLPMACALGLGDFASALAAGAGTLCRWPNDAVSAAGKKFAGILAEAFADADGTTLVVGIGVNLTRDLERDGGLARPASSLEEILSRRLEQEEALAGLLPLLAKRISTWEKWGFAGIREDLEARLWGKGENVTARTDAGPIRGRMAGLGNNGELILETAAGRVGVSSAAALDWERPA